MGVRYRKRVKVAPGVHMNFSKSGVSTSIGKPGATVNVSSRGTKLTTGIPGTGISSSQMISKKSKALPRSKKFIEARNDIQEYYKLTDAETDWLMREMQKNPRKFRRNPTKAIKKAISTHRFRTPKGFLLTMGKIILILLALSWILNFLGLLKK